MTQMPIQISSDTRTDFVHSLPPIINFTRQRASAPVGRKRTGRRPDFRLSMASVAANPQSDGSSPDSSVAVVDGRD